MNYTDTKMDQKKSYNNVVYISKVMYNSKMLWNTVYLNIDFLNTR